MLPFLITHPPKDSPSWPQGKLEDSKYVSGHCPALVGLIPFPDKVGRTREQRWAR